jgi:peptidoglycan-associated lipoprotein
MRRRLLSTTALVSVLIVASGFMTLMPTADGAVRPVSRLQAAMTRAADTQPRFTPKAPDGVDEFVAVPELKPVQFAFNKAHVRAADARSLDADAAWLNHHPEYAILIAGHADQRGSDQYNLALGERRARALRDQLVARGVRDGRIALVSYGEGLPSCRAQLEPCWATNRAAVILVRRDGPQRP